MKGNTSQTKVASGGKQKVSPRAAPVKNKGSGKNPSEAEVTAVYREVLGRNPEPAGLDNWMRSGMTGDKLKRKIAEHAGTTRGADPARYGVRVRDVSTLDKNVQETYNKYKGKLGWESLTPAVIKEIRDLTYAFKTPEARSQFDSGRIKAERDGGNFTFVVSPDAVRTLGSDLSPHFASLPGAGWVYPSTINLNGTDEDVRLSGSRFSKESTFDAGGGQMMSGVRRIAKPKTGVFNTAHNFFTDKLGMSDDLAAITGTAVFGPAALPKVADEVFNSDAGYLIGDPLNLYSGITYGTEGATKNIKAGAKTFNTSEENFADKQGTTKQVAKVAANFIPGVGSAVSVGMGIVDNLNSAALGNTSWGKALTASGISAAAYGLGNSVTDQFVQAAISGGAGYASSRYVYDQSNSAALKSAAVSAAGSLAGNAASNASQSFAPAGWEFSSAAASSLAASAAVGQLAYETGFSDRKLDSDFWLSSGANAALVGFGSRKAAGEPGYKKPSLSDQFIFSSEKMSRDFANMGTMDFWNPKNMFNPRGNPVRSGRAESPLQVNSPLVSFDWLADDGKLQLKKHVGDGWGPGL
jgi:hypothetical protein